MEVLAYLGERLMAAKGMAAPDVGEVYTRARALCHQLGETTHAFRVLQGLCRFHEAQARLSTAAALAQQLFDLATRQPDRDLLRGWALAMRGDAGAGVAQIRQGLAVRQGEGLNLFRPYFLALLAEAYGLAGQPETGRQVLAEALTRLAETEERWWEPSCIDSRGLCGSNSRLPMSTRQKPVSGRPSI